MSSELHKHIEKAIDKQEKLFNAEVINFPNEKNLEISENFVNNDYDVWEIGDEVNADQLKTIKGICFMLIALTLMGLYSNIN